jgi:hypothetical protein
MEQDGILMMIVPCSEHFQKLGVNSVVISTHNVTINCITEQTGLHMATPNSSLFCGQSCDFVLIPNIILITTEF